MKLVLAVSILLTAICASVIHAMDVKVEAVIAAGQDAKPTDTFEADIPKLHVFFKSKGTKKGDTLRGVWIAEDVGAAAPKEHRIHESTMTSDKDDFFGAFSLSKPTKGWPAGKYRVEIYAGYDVAATVKFTILAADSGEG